MLQARARMILLSTSFASKTIGMKRIWDVVIKSGQCGCCGSSFIFGEHILAHGSAGNTQRAQYNNDAINHHAIDKTEAKGRLKIGENISRRDKTTVILKILSNLKESKREVYGALDAWVAWEEKFPIISIRQTLIMLEKHDKWHRIVQVIKWMLSKGQGTTMGTYEQLIRALDKDERAKEAHIFWKNRIGHDLHSVPWQLCELMISIYYRNNMLEHGVKLFKDLEAFGRKPPNKSIVRKIADSYQLLGLLDEQKKLLEKYDDLLSDSSRVGSRRVRRLPNKKDEKEKASSLPCS